MPNKEDTFVEMERRLIDTIDELRKNSSHYSRRIFKLTKFIAGLAIVIVVMAAVQIGLLVYQVYR